MDLKLIEYILKIADEGGISRAAEKLFITQSALNQQLLKLEGELGLQLFHRCKNDFHPTAAGEIYIRYGREMLQKKKEAYNILHDMANDRLGRLSVALTPERGIDMFTAIYPEFHDRFPRIIVEPQEMRVHDQLTQIVRGYMDLGFVTLREADKLPGNEYTTILTEPLLFAVSRRNPLAADAAPPDTPVSELPLADLSRFRDEPFILMFHTSTMASVIDTIFKNAGFLPQILFETASNKTIRSMIKNSLGCTILPREYFKFPDEIAYYRLPENPTWELCSVWKKGTWQTKFASCFTGLAASYFQQRAKALTSPVFAAKTPATASPES